jgi:hypothetical protein
MAGLSQPATEAKMTRNARPIAILLCPALISVLGCDKKDESSAAPAASSVAPSLAPPAATVIKYAIDSGGKTSIDMPAPKEHIKADTTAAAGELKVDLMDLANSRGEVRADLETLKTHTFGDVSKDDKQTEHALTWLEVGGQAPANVKEANRWATFAIRSIDGLSATDLTKVAPEKRAEGEVRTVTLTAHGDFLLHGHKAAKDAALEVTFHYPSGAPSDSKPTRVDVHSKAPLHIVLADHEVKPRDNLGAIAQGAFGLLGTKVAETADVSLDLHATLAP